MEKTPVFNHSLTHWPSLLDAPGTEACASEHFITDNSNATHL